MGLQRNAVEMLLDEHTSGGFAPRLQSVWHGVHKLAQDAEMVRQLEHLVASEDWQVIKDGWKHTYSTHRIVDV